MSTQHHTMTPLRGLTPPSGPMPLQRLYNRLELLGRVLAVLCCAWVGVVGNALTREMTPDVMANHRSPVIQEQIGRCEGNYASRYACADTILTKGGQEGALALLERLAATLMLPTVAWVMWHGVMEKARRLRHAAATQHNAQSVAETDSLMAAHQH